MSFGFILKKAESRQQKLELVSINALMPEQPLLRKVHQSVEFGFIRERVKPLNCEDNCVSALDPVVMFKLLLLISERSSFGGSADARGGGQRTYSWFVGMKLCEKVAGRIDLKPESPPPFRLEHDLRGDLR